MKMKKLLTILFVIALMTAFTACGGASEPKTLADVYDLETENFMEAYDAEYYACYYAIDGKYTRVSATMTQDLYDQADAISFDDPDRDAKVKEILGPVEVTDVQDITALVPAEDDVSALVGKTGQELMDEGYDLTYFAVNGDVTSVSATKDYCAYLFDFDGTVKDDDPAWKDKVAKMKVTEASFQDLDFTVLDADFAMPE